VTAPRRSGDLPRDVWLAKLEAVMRRLQTAGLDSIPGGGAEILVEHVRRRIGSTKANCHQWLDVMRTAHRLGMFTSATMMFGHIEGVADRIMHMQMIRDAQDEAWQHNWPGRYMAFIAWPFQPEHTSLGRLPRWNPETVSDTVFRNGCHGQAQLARETAQSARASSADSACPCHPSFAGDELADRVFAGEVDPWDKSACVEAVPGAGKSLRLAGATEYLRTQAIARLFFDNVHSIGSSWVTMGPKIGQIALTYGANDLGSVMMEENVVSAAGTTYCLNEATICRLIREAGYVPAQRDNLYRFLKVHEAAGPDLQVTDWSAHRPGDSSAFAAPVDITTTATS
jgi:cyclic dehypoxanthinyl futalosine synthase